MRQISTFLATCLAAVAAASDGSITIFDSAHSNQQPHAAVHEDAAKLLLQQRMVSTGSIASAALEEPVLELLNSYGVQNALFDETPRNSQQKLVVVIDGLKKDATAIKPKTPAITFPISRVSSDFMDNDMIESLLTSHENSASGPIQCLYEAAASPELQASNSYGLQSCMPHRYISGNGITTSQKEFFDSLPLSLLEAQSNSDDSKGVLRLTFKENTITSSMAVQLLDSLHELFNAPEQTFVLLPHANSKTSQGQPRGIRSPVFEYTKRSPKNAVPSTFAPVCYKSNNSCVAGTDNCSGHGTCSLKSTSKDDGCYTCKCKQTQVENAGGSVRTVSWGGSACQKEDISVPFFLLASITVLAILAIGAGISMLFSVGQQELPSVINAGVSSVKTTG
ncbi:hypothetical protein BGW36DRAFT_375697 [Talaromyces proteolyticus]|uniref:Vacuolar sorting protein Vps3844 C-terminal domain-containing protein n=1 Tax=Talaromyces proteolyticus TaxID=1131652 RepID=A0AAD4KXS8_9EURO|nr:uncharacterized protein BGW36DRAFT_375697 [Talaromyces proteolyticus]KAH8701162.1 hypothetical protein BGW36DRAFT_375697 [Talaromyces proteolyticus]